MAIKYSTPKDGVPKVGDKIRGYFHYMNPKFTCTRRDVTVLSITHNYGDFVDGVFKEDNGEEWYELAKWKTL